MFGLGKRRRHVESVAAMNEDGPVRPDGPSDAEVIARAARHTLRILAGPGDLDEVVRDLRAILIRSDAGRAVLGLPLEALGEDPFDRCDRLLKESNRQGAKLRTERDEARDQVARLSGFYESRIDRLRAERDASENDRNSLVTALGSARRALDEGRDMWRRDRTDDGNTIGRLQADIDRLQVDLAARTSERDEATREFVDEAKMLSDVVDGILDMAPESWDGEDAAVSIALGFTREMVARLLALRVPLDKHPEDPDGAPWPDARTDPNGFADAADAYRRMHSGCRCKGFGPQTPEHSPSVLCKPEPGDRRCMNVGCSREGEFGHEDQPVSFDDPWANVKPDGTVTAPVATGGTVKGDRVYMVGEGDAAPEPEPWCGKPIRRGKGDPELVCSLPPGHDPTPWCGLFVAGSDEGGEWTVSVPREGGARYFEDAQHFETACDDRPHCTIVEHHAVEDVDAGGGEQCDADTPHGRCTLGAGHPVGPMYPGFSGHIPPGDLV